MLSPFIVKVSVLDYFPLEYVGLCYTYIYFGLLKHIGKDNTII